MEAQDPIAGRYRLSVTKGMGMVMDMAWDTMAQRSPRGNIAQARFRMSITCMRLSLYLVLRGLQQQQQQQQEEEEEGEEGEEEEEEATGVMG